MTLMTNDLNDHHDRMVVVEVFLFYDKKKQNVLKRHTPLLQQLPQLITYPTKLKVEQYHI